MSKAIPMWYNRKAGGCAISIETQAHCNMMCSECPRNLDPTRSRWKNGEPIRDKMPTKMVHCLIREASEMGWRGPVHFSHYSEPLVDDRFVSFCKYARRYGLVPELYTNGTLLTPALANEIDGLVSYVVLSFRSVGTLKYWKSLFNKSKVRVCDGFQVLIWNPRKQLLRDAIQRVRDESCVDPLFTAFRINYDGQMSMCYADFNNEFGLLNAFTHSLRELWFGEEHINAVKEMSKPGSRQLRALCRQCPEVYPNNGTYVKVERKTHPSEGEYET